MQGDRRLAGDTDWTMKPPSLDGFDAKVARARTHHKALQKENKKIATERRYKFQGEIHDGGLVHRYRVQNPPPTDPTWSTTIGDCLYNLRSALDYLANQLVLLSGHTPTRKTCFPILDPNGTRTNLHVHGGVSDDVLKVVESVQPYLGGERGQRLWRLHRLNNIDKHRQLLLAAAMPRGFSFDSNPGLHPLYSLDREYNSLGEITGLNGEPIFEIKFMKPVGQLTPNMKAIPMISFSQDEADVGGLDVDLVLTELYEAVEHEIRPRFASFFKSHSLCPG